MADQQTTKWQPPKKIYLFDMDGNPQGAEIVWCEDKAPDENERDVYEYKLVKQVSHAKD